MQHQVLIYGHDRILLQTRELILRGAGFDVCVTDVLGEAQKFLATRPVDLLILCHSVDEAERATILATARAFPKPPGILLLSVGIGSSVSPDNNATFSTFEGPHNFLGVVCRLTHESVPDPSSYSSPTGQKLCHDLQAR